MKMPKILLLVTVLLSELTFAQVHSKKSIDFSSVDAFWDIAKKIKKKKVKESDWDYLFSTGYYKFYEDMGQRKYIQNTLITALSLENKSKRDSLLKINDFNAYVLKQIISTNAKKVQLEKFLQTLKNRDLIKDISERAKEFLPGNLNLQSINEPSVYVGVFQPDANASKTSIAFDLKLFFELADPIGLIAHEYHHFLTMNFRKKFKEIKNDSTSLIMHSISQLQLEGIADMIDKDRFLNSNGVGFPSILIETYKKAYADPLPNLKKIDSLLAATSIDPLNSKLNSKAIADLLPLGGHPHGFYMAKLILAVSGKDALLNTISNPFDFIRAYNIASQKINGTATFSNVSMKFLELIESTHSY